MIKQYPQFLSDFEIDQIIDWLDAKPWSSEKYKDLPNGTKTLYNRHKNLDFHLEESLIRQIVWPKLQKMLYTTNPSHSGFLESHYPYDIHVDTTKTFQNQNIYQVNAEFTGQSFLVPLNQHQDFKTVFFDYHTDNLDYPEDVVEAPAAYDNKKFSGIEHLRSASKKFVIDNQIEVSSVVNWQRGHAFSWPRNQLHCSGNFDRGCLKHALVMFF